MNVIFVSQCEKAAINETRRILDQFAERTGVRTWATPVTQNGLDTIRKLLKQTARKNTAVACHWIHSGGNFEMVWIVGNALKFSATGRVPTNLTETNVLKKRDEHDWHHLHVISLLARLAALFHDFGKANRQFQAKLRDSRKTDAFRHEWVSLRMFEAFVGSCSDREWLERLSHDGIGEVHWMNRLQTDGTGTIATHPFAHLPPIARAVAWLILSHHALPFCEGTTAQSFQNIYGVFDASWTKQKPDVPVEPCWQFEKGAPSRSRTWRSQAAELAKSALKALPDLQARDWSIDPYALHVARWVLILSDHHYSGRAPTSKWQDPDYKVFANTDRETATLKQQLDEHLIGVADIAKAVSRHLPKLAQELPRIARHRSFSRDSSDPKFRWQAKAFGVAEQLRTQSFRHGFFGVNMASTGCGKTLANARIMYALADPELGARFSIALGLRTLTLQTGTALADRLGLQEDDMAVMVGNAAVRELYALDQAERLEERTMGGSESAHPLLPEHHGVLYEGTISSVPLKAWLDGARSQANKLVHAPVLVCTIDHLISACESVRGGHHIAPMLRLMTADLVLDEPDDFDLSDLPALTRLVFFAGLMGSRLLLSSATLAPALVQGLFAAYLAGRTEYSKHRSEPGLRTQVCCAWFDEFSAQQQTCSDLNSFSAQQSEFVEGRLKRLHALPSKRYGAMFDVSPVRNSGISAKQSAVRGFAAELLKQIPALHAQHHLQHQGLRVSAGLVRMANIVPLIETAKLLLRKGWSQPTHVHLCVYHARFPLLMRSAIERVLDRALQRTHQLGELDPFVRHPDVAQAIKAHPNATEHIFVVLASPVAELGRDHCYDWAICEPSSLRSLIQLSGRVRRHRPLNNPSANVALSNFNIRGLCGESVCFTRPGFESPPHTLQSKELKSVLRTHEFQCISAAPRLQQANDFSPSHFLADLEHYRLAETMLPDRRDSVHRYWQSQSWLTAVEQRKRPFRSGPPNLTYFLSTDAHGQRQLSRFEIDGAVTESLDYEVQEPAQAEGISIWPLGSFASELHQLATRLNIDEELCARRHATLELEVDGPEFKHKLWKDLGPLGFSLV